MEQSINSHINPNSSLKNLIAAIVRKYHTKAAQEREARERRIQEKLAKRAAKIIAGLPDAVRRALRQKRFPGVCCVMMLEPGDHFPPRLELIAPTGLFPAVDERKLQQAAKLVFYELQQSGLNPRLWYTRVSPRGATPQRYKPGIFIHLSET